MGIKRRLGALLLALFLVTALSEPGQARPPKNGEAVGYYAAWAAGQGYKPEDIPAERFTQINYAFAKIENGLLVLENPERDRGLLKRLAALRSRNPDLKIVLSVGGWDGSGGFSDAASSDSRRRIFARSCLELLQDTGLDGLDLDWEYPVSGGAAGTVHRPQDKQNFTLLLKTLRETLGQKYRLTIAGALGSGYLNQIEPQAAAEQVDHIFLMAYDVHGPWDRYTDFNAPLYTPTDASPQQRSSVDSGLSAWLDRGVPPEKLILGMPLYGYIYHGVSSRNNGLYNRYDRAQSIPWNRVKSEYLNHTAYLQLRHPEAETPYLYGNRTFLSYDDPASIAAKAALARKRGLGGVGFWELSQDAAGELTESAWTAWNGGGFLDVPHDVWYAGAVEAVCAAGLMKGTGPGTFSPGAAVTRGQIAAIVHRLAGEPAAGGTAFSDAPSSAYYGRAVAWAAETGVVTGFADGTFRPDLPVTRQQLAAIFWRYAVLQGKDSGKRAALEDCRDFGQVGAYAREPLSWAAAEGILQGTKGGDLLPQGTAARGQTAVMLERFQRLLA